MKYRNILLAFQASESKFLKDVDQENSFILFLLTEGKVIFFSYIQNAFRGPMFSILIISTCPEITGFIQAGSSSERASNVINIQYCYLNNN